MNLNTSVRQHQDLVDDLLDECPPPLAVEPGQPPSRLGAQPLDRVGAVHGAVLRDLRLGRPQLFGQAGALAGQLAQLALDEVLLLAVADHQGDEPALVLPDPGDLPLQVGYAAPQLDIGSPPAGLSYASTPWRRTAGSWSAAVIPARTSASRAAALK
jgi:hypothetical protein